MASIAIALAMSIFIAGLGIAYLGDKMQAMGIFLIWSISALIAIYADGIIVLITAAAALVVWSYSLYAIFFLTFKNQ